MSKTNTKATINANIKPNGVQAITGQILNSVLNQMVDDYGTQEDMTAVQTAIPTLATKTELTALVNDVKRIGMNVNYKDAIRLTAASFDSLSMKTSIINVLDTDKTLLACILPSTMTDSGWLYEYEEGWRLCKVNGFTLTNTSTWEDLLDWMDLDGNSTKIAGETAINDIKAALTAQDAKLTELESEVFGVAYTAINGEYVNPTGGVRTSSVGFLTKPIPIRQGEKLTFSIKGWACAILSSYNGGVYTPIITTNIGREESFVDVEYTSPSDGYVVFSGTPGTLVVSSDYSRIDRLDDYVDKLNDVSVSYTAINGKYITRQGEVRDSSAGFLTEPIPVRQGEKLTFSIKGIACAALSLYDNGVYTPIITLPDSSTQQTYEGSYTSPSDGYVVFSGTPGTLVVSSDILNATYRTNDEINGLKRMISSLKTSSPDDLKHGMLTDTGEVINTRSSAIMYVEGGKAFHMRVNDAYSIDRVNLYEGSSDKLLQANFCGHTSSFVPFQFDSYKSYGQDTAIKGQYLLISIKKDNGQDISDDDLGNILKSFCYLTDPRLHRWVLGEPYFLYAHKRMRSLFNIQWECLNRVLPVTAAFNNYRFFKGQTYNGAPYSDVSEKNKYVGHDVSPYTFLTAAKNRRSVIYTEDLKAKTSKYGIVYDSSISVAGCFYGSVCSGLTALMMGLPIIYLVSRYNDSGTYGVPNMETIPFSGIDSLRPLDLIYYGGHISIISDIYKDDYGKVKYILWAEYNYPNGFINVYTPEVFAERIAANNAVIRRYSGWSETCTDIDVSPLIPSDFCDYNNDTDLEKDIHVYTGDKSCFSLDDPIYLNLNRTDGYNRLLVYKDDDDEPYINADISSLPKDSIIPDDTEDWVCYDLKIHDIASGKYKARLTDGARMSGYVYFEVLNTDVEVNVVDDHIRRVDFATDAHPVAVTFCGQNYYTTSFKMVTDVEREQGYCEMNVSKAAERYLTIFFKGDYGRAYKRIKTSDL